MASNTHEHSWQDYLSSFCAVCNSYLCAHCHQSAQMVYQGSGQASKSILMEGSSADQWWKFLGSLGKGAATT
jgi:hypothetical protein